MKTGQYCTRLWRADHKHPVDQRKRRFLTDRSLP
uniref:Uncharacterized protein n=1 Tax=Anguilla anguilla TaxID=7936 RepID=A0A0E9RFL9_ANGAN